MSATSALCRRQVLLTAGQREELEAMANAHWDADVSRRARLVLLRSAGHTIKELQDALDLSRPTVRKWLDEYGAGGARALRGGSRDDLPRSKEFGALTRDLPLNILCPSACEEKPRS